MECEDDRLDRHSVPALPHAKRMISWLCDAFGFRPQAVYEDGSGAVAHAQLTLVTE